jgi:hypothetical protein
LKQDSKSERRSKSRVSYGTFLTFKIDRLIRNLFSFQNRVSYGTCFFLVLGNIFSWIITCCAYLRAAEALQKPWLNGNTLYRYWNKTDFSDTHHYTTYLSRRNYILKGLAGVQMPGSLF